MSITGTFGTSQKAQAVAQILSQGIATRNMQAVVNKRGAQLPAQLTAQDQSVLLSLTDAELAAMQSVNTKLAPLGLSALY